MTTSDDQLLDFVDQVYSIKVIEIFKGKENVTQVKGTHFFGVRNPSLMADIFTPSKMFSCDVHLERGVEYILAGYIYDNKLRMHLCNWHEPWANVTPLQRKGLKGQFNVAC